jgi:hypothetical protein
MRKQTNAMSSHRPIPKPQPTKTKSSNSSSSSKKYDDDDNHHTFFVPQIQVIPKCRQKCKIDISVKEREKNGKTQKDNLVPSCAMLPIIVGGISSSDGGGGGGFLSCSHPFDLKSDSLTVSTSSKGDHMFSNVQGDLFTNTMRTVL